VNLFIIEGLPAGVLEKNCKWKFAQNAKIQHWKWNFVQIAKIQHWKWKFAQNAKIHQKC
jgi:hypothetical protein